MPYQRARDQANDGPGYDSSYHAGDLCTRKLSKCEENDESQTPNSCSNERAKHGPKWPQRLSYGNSAVKGSSYRYKVRQKEWNVDEP